MTCSTVVEHEKFTYDVETHKAAEAKRDLMLFFSNVTLACTQQMGRCGPAKKAPPKPGHATRRTAAKAGTEANWTDDDDDDIPNLDRTAIGPNCNSCPRRRPTFLHGKRSVRRRTQRCRFGSSSSPGTTKQCHEP